VGKLLDTGLGNDFCAITQKTQITKAKISFFPLFYCYAGCGYIVVFAKVLIVSNILEFTLEAKIF
jgi:hypothetical protein